MRIVALSDSFYSRYGKCREILKKSSRPYVCLMVRIDDINYAIPLRHHIHHKYAFHTIGEAGIDFSKCVPLIEDDFISKQYEPRIETKEWNILKGNEDRIVFEFRKYINQYKRALQRPDNPRSRNILAYSSLQYFDLY